jgi:signal transduction histidine kinase
MAALKTQDLPQSGFQYIKTSIIFGLCYWAMEAVQDVITFERGTLVERLLLPDAKALWMRVLVICVILLFGVVADSLKKRQGNNQWRLILRSEWGIFSIGLLFSVIYWIVESVRYAFIYNSGSFLEMALTPDTPMFWVRLMAVFFLVLFALFMQINTNALKEDERALQIEQSRLEELLTSKSFELREAKTLISRLRHEIERRKRLEKENTKIQNQLIKAQKVEAIGIVAGGIAHDFNNLMTAVLGVSTLALKEAPADSALYRDIKEIYNAASRAADLTRQLLLLGCDHPMKFGAINLNHTICQLKKMLQSLVGEDIILTFDLDENLGIIQGDRGTLEQTLINLVVNGRDALPRGGEIAVRTRNVQLKTKSRSPGIEKTTNRYICLSVMDTGTGIPEEIREKIFDPFFSTKPQGTGTGLGLSVVDRIIKKHHGWIEVESIPGQNTVFSVFLPIIATQVEKQTGPQKECFSQGFGKRILLVEDEDGVREFTRRALNKNGYTVITANCAEEAEQIFRRDREGFDLLFTDVVLPDKNGVELVLDLKASCPELNVLLCSGHNDSKSQSATIEKYGFPFLKKPFELNELLRGVQQVI